jgi:hypothetical protein
VQCYSSLDWLFYLRAPVLRRLTVWLADGMETAHHAEAFTGSSVQGTIGFSVEAEGICQLGIRIAFEGSPNFSAAPSFNGSFECFNLCSRWK